MTIKEHIAHVKETLLHNGLLNELKKTFPDAKFDISPFEEVAYIDLNARSGPPILVYLNSNSFQILNFAPDEYPDAQAQEEHLHNTQLAKTITSVYMLSEASKPALSEERQRELVANHASEIINSLFYHLIAQPSDYDLLYNEKYLGYNHSDQYERLIKDLKDTLEFKPDFNHLINGLGRSLDQTVTLPDNPGGHITTSTGELEREVGYTLHDIINHCNKVCSDIITAVKASPHYSDQEKQLLEKVEEFTLTSLLLLNDKPSPTLKSDMDVYLKKYNVTSTVSPEILSIDSEKKKDNTVGL